MIKKRVALFVLLFFISIQAFAFIPLLLNGVRLVAVELKTPAGTAALNSVLATGLAIQVITALRNGTDGSSHATTFNLTNAPIAPSAEETAAGYVAGFPAPVPPPTVPQSIQYWVSGLYPSGTRYNTALAACQSHTVPFFIYDLSTKPNNYPPAINCRFTYTITNAITDPSQSALPVFGCPAGYTLAAGSNCALVNVAAVVPPSDGHCPIVRSGSAYTTNPTDPDCAAGVTPQFLPDGSIEISDETGHSIKVRNGSKPGERIWTERIPGYDVNGKPITREKTIVLQDGPTEADPPKVTGQSDMETPGQGVQAPPDEPPMQIDTSAITAAIAAQTAADEAREQARIAKEEADRQLPTFNESIPKEFIPVSISAINFAGAAVCPVDIGFSMLGKTYTISYAPMCELMSTLRPLFLALGAFGAAFIFMGGLKV